ncbi:putative membrane protein [Wolbachia pipientis wVitA]|nr:putative membrane protein [Wolbachia pipientis wVitA]
MSLCESISIAVVAIISNQITRFFTAFILLKFEAIKINFKDQR